jgi:hypothetical protein
VTIDRKTASSTATGCEPDGDLRDGGGFGYSAERMLLGDQRSALAHYVAKRDGIAHDW